MVSKIRKKDMKGLFEPAKNPRLARIISTETPAKFRKSILTLSKGGLSLQEFRALTLAKTRAKLQLRRPNLSAKERREFRMIANTKIPKSNTKKALNLFANFKVFG